MFEHTLLDGAKYRIINNSSAFMKPEILELREGPGAISDTPRTQFSVAGEVLVKRHLPAEGKGETWSFDPVAAPWWEVVGHPPHGGIIFDFNEYIGGAYHRVLDTEKNVVAFAENGEEVIFDGSEYSVTRAGEDEALRAKQLPELRQQYYQ